jgi:hypothetical protein
LPIVVTPERRNEFLITKRILSGLTPQEEIRIQVLSEEKTQGELFWIAASTE